MTRRVCLLALFAVTSCAHRAPSHELSLAYGPPSGDLQPILVMDPVTHTNTPLFVVADPTQFQVAPESVDAWNHLSPRIQEAVRQQYLARTGAAK